MKLYVAGASSEYAKCKALAEWARRFGYEIVSEWWNDVEKTRAVGKIDRDLDHEMRRDLATKDICGVQLAQLFWLVVPEGETTGAWAELGAAIVLGCTIIVSGDHRKSLFTSKATQLFETHEDALTFLQDFIAPAGAA